MTNEEAAKILRRIQEPEAWEPQINGAAFEALDMAIEALGRQQASGSKDLISRQSLLAKYDEQHEGPPGRARKLIEDEPPALGTNLAEVSTDLISRQQAIDDIWTVSPLARLDSKWVDRWLRQLPAAEPEPIRINLNEPIKVKLTDWGKEIYYHQYDRINQITGREICKPKFPKEDENGYTEIQLWCFMELYGEHMGMTMPNVIKPLEIVYER